MYKKSITQFQNVADFLPKKSPRFFLYPNLVSCFNLRMHSTVSVKPFYYNFTLFIQIVYLQETKHKIKTFKIVANDKNNYIINKDYLHYEVGTFRHGKAIKVLVVSNAAPIDRISV